MDSCSDCLNALFTFNQYVNTVSCLKYLRPRKVVVKVTVTFSSTAGAPHIHTHKRRKRGSDFCLTTVSQTMNKTLSVLLLML